jgi:hypothetical protein
MPITALCLFLHELRPQQSVSSSTLGKGFLRRLRPQMASSRMQWQRVLCIKVDAENGSAMVPYI